MTAITRQEALTKYSTSLPNIRLNRVALLASETSQVKTGANIHTEEKNAKAGLMKDRAGPTCNAEISFALEESAGARGVRPGKVPQISSVKAATMKIKFAVFNTTKPINISYKESGEPIFATQNPGEPPVSEKIFPLSDFITAENTPYASNAVATENSIIRTANLTLSGIPADEPNLSLFYMIYTDKDNLAERFATTSQNSSKKVTSAYIPRMNSPHSRQVLVQGGEPPPTLERFFYPDGQEFTGHPYKEEDADGSTKYSFSFEDFHNSEKALVRRNVTNNLIQDFRNVSHISQPASFDFTSMHNLIENIGAATKDLGQRLNFFENPAVFSTLQTSFDESGGVVGVFSIDFLKALRSETLFPALLLNKNDEIKRAFVSEVLGESNILSLKITRESIMSAAEQAELGQGTSLLKAETFDEGHVVVEATQGGSGVKYKSLDYAGGTTSALPQVLCGRVQEISLSGYGLRHFMFKDYDVSAERPGQYQYSCQVSIDNSIRKVLLGKRTQLNIHCSILRKAYEIACQGSVGPGVGHYNANVKRFRNSFSQALVSLYGQTYEQIIASATFFYVNLLFTLTDERDRKIFEDPNSQTSDTSSLTAGRLQNILSGFSMTLEGLETLLSLLDGLNSSIHTIIGSSDNSTLSRQDYARVGGMGGTSMRSVLEVENRFDEIVNIHPQLTSKYDFVFSNRTSNNTIMRSISMAAFEDRWAMQQKKYFKNGVVEQGQTVQMPLPGTRSPSVDRNVMDSMIYFSPTRVTSRNAENEVVVTGEVNSSEVGPGAYSLAFQKLLYESAINEPDATRSTQQVGNTGQTVSSVMLNETLGAVNNLTIVERNNDLVSFTGKASASPEAVLGNAVSLSVTNGVQNFAGLINYITMNSVLNGFRDDLITYNVRPTAAASQEAVNLSRAGYYLFNENLASTITEGASIPNLLSGMPSSVMSLVLAATPPTSQVVGSGVNIATETASPSSLSEVSSLNDADVFPYFVMNYKILACLEVFRGFEEKTYLDAETDSSSKDYCMGEPKFVKTNLNELRQYIQDEGRVLCRVRRYYRNFYNIKENEYFDFPIANSLFMIEGTTTRPTTTTTTLPSAVSTGQATMSGLTPTTPSGY